MDRIARAIAQARSRTATVVVAASNSSTKGKQAADYVCDGVADDVEINAAIAQVATLGGKVSLFEGTFNIASSINITASNIVLEGQGMGTVLRLADGANTSVIVATGSTQTTPYYIYYDSIKNLRIDGNKANQTGISHGIFFNTWVGLSAIKGVDVKNCLTSGIMLYGTQITQFYGPDEAISSGNGCVHITITETSVRTSGNDNIHVEKSDAVKIVNCPYIYGAGNAGIYLDTSPSFMISDVYIPGLVGVSQQGLYIHNSSNGQVARVNSLNGLNNFLLDSNSNNNSFNSCFAEGSLDSSLKIVTSTYNEFVSCNFPSSRTNSIEISGGAYNRFISCNINNASVSTTNTYSHVYLHTTSILNTFINCTIKKLDGTQLAKYAIYETDTSNYNRFVHCYFWPAYYGTATVSMVGANSQVKNNFYYITENKGTAIVASGSTSIVVTHGLSITPNIQDIIVTPTNNPTNAVKYWVSNITSTQFTINTSADPGTSTATFAWQIN